MTEGTDMALTLEQVRREIDRLRERRRRSSDAAEKAALQSEIDRLVAIRDAMVAQDDGDFEEDIRGIVANLERIRTSANLSAESAIATTIANLTSALPPAG
jgi:hypothetical protein